MGDIMIRFNEYVDGKMLYVLMNKHGSAVVNNGSYFKSEAISPTQAKNNILYRLRNLSAKNNIIWNIISNPEDYIAIPYSEWEAKQPKLETPPLPKSTLQENQGELFNRRWND